MAGINKVILIGNLGEDPEVRYTTDGKVEDQFLAMDLSAMLHTMDKCLDIMQQTQSTRPYGL